MWKCEKCEEIFDNETMAVEVRFGYIDEDEAKKKDNNQYDAFYTEQAWAPLCDDCAIDFIKTGT